MCIRICPDSDISALTRVSTGGCVRASASLAVSRLGTVAPDVENAETVCPASIKAYQCSASHAAAQLIEQRLGRAAPLNSTPGPARDAGGGIKGKCVRSPVASVTVQSRARRRHTHAAFFTPSGCRVDEGAASRRELTFLARSRSLFSLLSSPSLPRPSPAQNCSQPSLDRHRDGAPWRAPHAVLA